MLSLLIKEIQSKRNLEKAKILQGFFKTREGEYGEGDFFLGLTSGQIKNIAKKYSGLSLPKLQILIRSKVHEYRMCVLRILILKYEKADENGKARIFNFYLQNTEHINNWDLVDISAVKIVGHFLFDKEKSILYKFAKSKNLWEKRIAIISTYYFIRQGEFNDALKISEILMKDSHDLIHKAVGWMLREIGNRNPKIEKKFLKEYYKTMPRTMLRYAIENFPEVERKKWLRGEI